MNGKPAKRSSFFLMELIIAILFFSLASAVCVRFFVKSHTLSQDTKELNMAVNHVSGCAELFLAKEDFPSTSSTYLNDNWEVCEPENATYILDEFVEDDGAFQNGTFSLKKVQTDVTVYTLNVRRYMGTDTKQQEVAR